MTLDTASPNRNLPPYPVTMHPAGRFMLPVPKGLNASSSVFKVNKITIEELLSDDHLTVKGNSHRKITEKWLVRTGAETHLKSDIKTVFEAGTELTIMAGGSFIKIDASGVTITGAKVKINSGGSPGSGSGARPLLPGDAHLPEIEEAWRPDGDELLALKDSSSGSRRIGMPFCARCAPLPEGK